MKGWKMGRFEESSEPLTRTTLNNPEMKRGGRKLAEEKKNMYANILYIYIYINIENMQPARTATRPPTGDSEV